MKYKCKTNAIKFCFSGYDCHLKFEELLTHAYTQKYEIKNPKIIRKLCFSPQVGCLRFLYSYRFLSSRFNKLVKSLDCVPITESVFGIKEILNKKLEKKKTVFDKPIFLGFTVLELSKLFRFDLYSKR